MAPNFALFLSPEGIALAHRQPAGHWAVLGDTALDVPDLGASLLVLRKMAEARAGEGFETLVILPDDQVLYTSLTAPGPGEADRLDQIHAGLDGLTPYPVDKLAFDWFPLDDGRVKLAVVAQETLEEARQFAMQHGFTPVGFGARPLDSRFRGVAHFDRSPDWVADLADIEFGHDTWRAPRDEPAPDTEEDEGAAVPDEPPATAEAPPGPEGEVSVETAPEAEQEADAILEEAPEVLDTSGAPDPQAGPAESERPEADAGPEAPSPARVTGRLHLAPTTEADIGEDAPLDDRDKGEDTLAQDAPLQVPAGFGARRARGKDRPTPKAGPGKRGRKARKADTAEPRLPRSLPASPDTSDAPSFGRARQGGNAPTQDGPARPPAAGPEPKLPPLARLKSELQTRSEGPDASPPKTRFGKDPFSNRAVESEPRPSLRDRMAGIGRQLSEGTGKARDAASGLSDKISTDGLKGRLKSFTERNAGSGATAEESAPAPSAEESPPAIDSPRRKRRRAAKAETLPGAKDPAALKAAIETKAPKPEEIAPPPAKTRGRARFTPPKRRSEPRIAEADAPIMGGLLARGSVATQRGPSIRTGLVLTLVLLAVLGLVALWAAFYLPDTVIGRWMGFGSEEEPVIVAETEPDTLDAPGLTGAAPAAADAPVELARLPAALEPPVPLMVAPEAPNLLPDIDADLDLGPTPVPTPAFDPETVLPSPEENANFYARTGIWQRPPVMTAQVPEIDTGDLIFAGLDPPVTMHDAVALGPAGPLPRTELAALRAIEVAPGAGVPLRREDLVAPSPEGTLSPYGIRIFAGPPGVPAQPRPNDNPAALAAARAEADAPALAEAVATPEGSSDTASPSLPAGAVNLALLQGVRPESRPEDLLEQRERARLGGITLDELSTIRPEGRPASVQELAAQAAAADSDVAGASDLAVAVSYVPSTRPANIAEMVAATRAAGNSGPQGARPPVAANASDTIEVAIPSEASVTRAATEENAINLREVNLIGVSGAPSERRALIRMPTGRFLTVEVGDRLDGGQVAPIGESTLQYVKRGRTITLQVPSG